MDWLESREKTWIIMDTLSAELDRGGFRIDKSSAPTFIHLDKNEAEEELLRLQKEHGGNFVLFESVATARRCEADFDVLFVDEILSNTS